MTADDFIRRLGQGVRPTADGGWMARCPSHEDSRASLSVTRGENGILIHCFAQCTADQICAGLGLTTADLFYSPTNEPPTTTVNGNDPPGLAAKYEYQDEIRAVLFQVLRFVGKRFKQRRPDPSQPGGWAWDLKGVRRVPYRLPELLAAPPERMIYVVEGEKDVETVQHHGLVATTNPGGASGSNLWKTPPFRDVVRGRHVTIIPDNDDPGRAHARAVASALRGVSASIRILELSDLPEKGDVSDWFHRGGTGTELERIAKGCQPTPFETSAQGDETSNEEKGDKPRQTEKLVELAQEKIELFKTIEDEAFVSLRRGDHQETHPVGSRQFRRYLTERFYRSEGRIASANAMSEAIATLDALAAMGDDIRQVELRVSEHAESSYVDLGTSTWQVAQISPGGWQVIPAKEAPVRFRRPRAMLPLPVPVHGGDLEELRPYLNPGSVENWRLMVAWLTFALRPQGPFPVLVVQGEQGSAKSTTTRVLRAMLDPSVSELRMMPKDVQDLLVAARNSWLLAYDNLSGMPPWLSDGLCVISTGGTFTTRALYTADEETSLTARRPSITNGIDDMTTRPDLADRAVMVSLPTIPPERRREEAEFWSAFHAAHARLLGALYSAAAAGLRALPTVHLVKPPRMADFAAWGVALERGLGWPAGSLLEAYLGNLAESASAALEADPVAMAVLALIKHSGSPWEGGVSKLLNELEKHVAPERRGRSWPRSPQSLTSRMRRAAPALRREGIAILQPPRSNRGALWTIREVNVPENSSPSSPLNKTESLPVVVGDEGGERESSEGAELPHGVTNGVDVTVRQKEFVTFAGPVFERAGVEDDDGDEHCFLSKLGRRNSSAQLADPENGLPCSRGSGTDEGVR